MRPLEKGPKPYQSPAIIETINELGNGKDIAIQLPTGTGKTFVYLPVAIAATNKGYRVCILVATNLIMGQIMQRYLPYFKTGVVPYDVMGIENYDCSITNDKADYAICTPEQREQCLIDHPECNVLHTNRQLEEHGFILTNFHKFLSTPTERGFDLIIIDDSHGFENALDDKFQSRLAYYQVEGLYQRREPFKDIISDFTGTFLDLFDDTLRAVPPEDRIRRVPDDNVKEMARIEGYEQVQSQIRGLEELDMDVCYELLYFVKCCQQATLNTFYVQKDFYNPDDPREAVLIARKSETFQDNVIKSLFDDARVIFVSATLGDVETHASYCTHREYLGEDLVVLPKSQPDVVKDWFKGLHIYETLDFPKGDEDPIERGAEVAADILKRTSGKSLLLFKNYRDQRKAESVLKKQVKRRITFIDDSLKTEVVQSLVEKADIIMATASSRLWEGIDISDLEMEIIFSLPFIRPPVYFDSKKSFPFVKRKMLIRLQQGIGRLIRKENDTGVCVILDNKLEKYKNDTNFSEAYRERIKLTTIEVVCDKVRQALGCA